MIELTNDILQINDLRYFERSFEDFLASATPDMPIPEWTDEEVMKGIGEAHMTAIDATGDNTRFAYLVRIKWWNMVDAYKKNHSLPETYMYADTLAEFTRQYMLHKDELEGFPGGRKKRTCAEVIARHRKEEEAGRKFTDGLLK